MVLDMLTMDMVLAMEAIMDSATEDTTFDKSSHCHTCSLLNDNHISIGK